MKPLNAKPIAWKDVDEHPFGIMKRCELTALNEAMADVREAEEQYANFGGGDAYHELKVAYQKLIKAGLVCAEGHLFSAEELCGR